MLPAPKLSETVNLCRFFLLSERCYAFVGKDDMMCYGKVSLCTAYNAVCCCSCFHWWDWAVRGQGVLRGVWDLKFDPTD
jgi:hypothetical protein